MLTTELRKARKVIRDALDRRGLDRGLVTVNELSGYTGLSPKGSSILRLRFAATGAELTLAGSETDRLVRWIVDVCAGATSFVEPLPVVEFSRRLWVKSNYRWTSAANDLATVIERRRRCA